MLTRPDQLRPSVHFETRLAQVRSNLSNAVRQLVAGDEQPRPIDGWDSANPALIPLDSPVRIVHRDAAMFVGGVRSLLLQSLHPVAMQAVADHSDFRDDPLRRLQNTARFLATTTFGPGDQARAAIARVNKIHSQIRGLTADGLPYSASDPHLLKWVHITEVDGFLETYQRYGPRPLSDGEADLYVSHLGRIGAALGVLDPPRSCAELKDCIASYRPELGNTTQCQETTRFLFAPPLPLAALLPYCIIFAAAVGTLPRWASSMLMIRVPSNVDRVAVRPAAYAVTALLRWAISDPADPVSKPAPG